MICRSNDTPCWIYGTGYRVVIDSGLSCAVDDTAMAGKVPLSDGYSLASLTSVAPVAPGSPVSAGYASPLPVMSRPDLSPPVIEPYSPYAPLIPLIYYPDPQPAPHIEIHQPPKLPEQPAPVPVPASASLMVCALAAIVVLRFISKKERTA